MLFTLTERNLLFCSYYRNMSFKIIKLHNYTFFVSATAGLTVGAFISVQLHRKLAWLCSFQILPAATFINKYVSMDAFFSRCDLAQGLTLNQHVI